MLMALCGRGGRAFGSPEEPPAKDALVAALRAAGLRGVGDDQTEHYVAVGDAPANFLKGALNLCEKIAASYEKHFQAKGFKVPFPKDRMTIVALAGRASYAAFKGEKVDDEEGGHYDVEANRLVIFDFRGGKGDTVADPLRANTFTLVHEGLHQLTFATGLLARKADVPRAVSEGLATYGETWKLSDPVLGRVNRLRLQELGKAGSEWIPADQLLTRDEVFDVDAMAQVAYAESWLLVYHLMTKAPAKLRAYLDLLRERREPAHRQEDAAKALGDLFDLDSTLKRTARLLLQGR
jgi:hypothetical protein